MGSVQFVEVQFFDKSADEIKSVADKVPTRDLSTSIFLTEQDQNVVNILTTLTLLFHDIQWPTVLKERMSEGLRAERAPRDPPGREAGSHLLCQKYTLLTNRKSTLFLRQIWCRQIARNRELTNSPSTNCYPPFYICSKFLKIFYGIQRKHLINLIINKFTF